MPLRRRRPCRPPAFRLAAALPAVLLLSFCMAGKAMAAPSWDGALEGLLGQLLQHEYRHSSSSGTSAQTTTIRLGLGQPGSTPAWPIPPGPDLPEPAMPRMPEPALPPAAFPSAFDRPLTPGKPQRILNAQGEGWYSHVQVDILQRRNDQVCARFVRADTLVIAGCVRANDRMARNLAQYLLDKKQLRVYLDHRVRYASLGRLDTFRITRLEP